MYVLGIYNLFLNKISMILHIVYYWILYECDIYDNKGYFKQINTFLIYQKYMDHSPKQR